MRNINVTDEKRKQFHFIDKTTGKQFKMETLEAFGLKWNFVRTLEAFFIKNMKEIKRSVDQLNQAVKEGDVYREKLLSKKIKDMKERQAELFEEILEWQHVAKSHQQTIPYFREFQAFLDTIPKLLAEKESALKDLLLVEMLKELVKTKFDVFVQFLTEWTQEEENATIVLKDLARIRGKKLVQLSERELIKLGINV